MYCTWLIQGNLVVGIFKPACIYINNQYIQYTIGVIFGWCFVCICFFCIWNLSTHSCILLRCLPSMHTHTNTHTHTHKMMMDCFYRPDDRPATAGSQWTIDRTPLALSLPLFLIFLLHRSPSTSLIFSLCLFQTQTHTHTHTNAAGRWLSFSVWDPAGCPVNISKRFNVIKHLWSQRDKSRGNGCCHHLLNTHCAYF